MAYSPLELQAGATGNRLLDHLPDYEFEALRDFMRVEPIELGRVVQAPGTEVRSVYFPLVGVLSAVTPLMEGAEIETATIGSEGMVGVEAFLGGGSAANTRVVGQVPGRMVVLGADAFRAHANGTTKLRGIMLSYTQALLKQIAQTVACNGAHEIQERTAKWLLEAHDRVDGSDTFTLTQEYLAQMLGVTRPSVSVAARTLQEAGLIRYRRGEITIVNRPGLEEASCECYAVVRREYERLLGPA